MRFEVHDVQTTRFTETFDYAFSRFGTMFFANPVAALRNVREALAPDGRFVEVVWRRREDNALLREAPAPYVSQHGAVLSSSTWVISASNSR